MSSARRTFESNKKDVLDLLSFHTRVGGTGRGRRPSEVLILNKSAIIFSASIWEAYIEEVVEEAVNHLATHTPDKDAITPYLRTLIEKGVQAIVKSDEKKIWDIAAKSVGEIIRDKAKRAANTLPNKNTEFNTAKTLHVSSLIRECLGLENVEDQWFWAGMSAAKAQEKLDKYIGIRGDLAHGNRLDASVVKLTATQMLDHIDKLVEKTDLSIHAHLQASTGVALP